MEETLNKTVIAGGKCKKSGIFIKRQHECKRVIGYGYRCKWCDKTLFSILQEKEGK